VLALWNKHIDTVDGVTTSPSYSMYWGTYTSSFASGSYLSDSVKFSGWWFGLKEICTACTSGVYDVNYRMGDFLLIDWTT
jgi:hypothetical protein